MLAVRFGPAGEQILTKILGQMRNHASSVPPPKVDLNCR
jgi:hypothetical protein